jgi:antitoxin MazE
MRTVVRKWGNSLGVRIPSGMAADVQLVDGTEVEIVVADGRLVLAPVRAPQVSLAELVAGITPENLHQAILDDAPRGSEAW